jgi:hypothetical protein
MEELRRLDVVVLGSALNDDGGPHVGPYLSARDTATKYVVWQTDSIYREWHPSRGSGTDGGFRARWEMLQRVLRRGDVIIVMPSREVLDISPDFPSDQSPFTYVACTRLEGELCKPADNAPALDSLSAIARYCTFTVSLTTRSSSGFRPLLVTARDSTVVVGGYVKPPLGGLILFLPRPKGLLQLADDTARLTKLKWWIEHAKVVADQLMCSGPDIVPPEWASRLSTVAARATALEIANREASVARLERERQEFTSVLAAENRLKVALYGTGDRLEDAVCELLHAMGFGAVKGPPKRCDVIAFRNDRLFAVEVKGEKGTLSEVHVMQASKWARWLSAALSTDPGEQDDQEREAESLAAGLGWKRGVHPAYAQAAAVICEQRESPLGDRISKVPDNVKATAARERVSVMTGCQLYCMAMELRAKPEKGPEIIAAIAATEGVVEKFDDWRAFLSE